MTDLILKFAKTRLDISPKEFRIILVASILFMAGAMAFVWPNVKMTKLAYKYLELANEQKQLVRENHLFKVEKESLESLDRIRSLALTKTDLRPAENGQIVTIFLK